MTFLRATLGLLGLRSEALRSLEQRKRAAPALLVFAGGFLAFALVRGKVYASLGEPHSPAPLSFLLRFGILPALLYFNLVLIPVLAVSINALHHAPRAFSPSRDQLRALAAVILPLWGLVLLAVAPLQLLVPEFIVVGDVAVSVGLLALACLMTFYGLWAVSRIGRLGILKSAGAILLGWLTLPVLQLFNTSGLAILSLLVLVALLSLWARQSSRRHTRGGDSPQDSTNR